MFSNPQNIVQMPRIQGTEIKRHEMPSKEMENNTASLVGEDTETSCNWKYQKETSQRG